MYVYAHSKDNKNSMLKQSPGLSVDMKSSVFACPHFYIGNLFFFFF